MPKAIEDCVKKISGTNKRTGKPYTQSEKWAICQAAHKQKQSKSTIESEITDDEIAIAEEHMEMAMSECHKKMMANGKAKTMEQAHELCEAELAKSGYDIHRLEFILDMNYILGKKGK